MKKLLTDRRLFIAWWSVNLLAALGYLKLVEVTAGIVTITLAVAGANAVEKILNKGGDDASKN